MVLDVSQLIQNDGAVKKIETEILIPDLTFNGHDIVFETPFRLKGAVKNIAGILYMDFDADVSFETQCARCLDKIKKSVSLKIHEAFSKNVQDDEEIIALDSGNIDLDEVCEKTFVGSMPISYLCSDDCKGLCSKCGCNLNHGQCLCDDRNIDPRLAVLKEFF